MILINSNEKQTLSLIFLFSIHYEFLLHLDYTLIFLLRIFSGNTSSSEGSTVSMTRETVVQLTKFFDVTSSLVLLWPHVQQPSVIVTGIPLNHAPLFPRDCG